MTRHATELFKPGELVTLDDGQGTITVWVQKLSPTHREKCVTMAKAARARVLATMANEDSDEWMSSMSDVLDLGNDPEILAQFCIAEEYLEAVQSVEARLADDDTDETNKWAKDGMFRSLQVAWEGSRDEKGLKEVWATWVSDHAEITDGEVIVPELGTDAPPEVQEAKRVWDLLVEFNRAVDEELAEVRNDLIAQKTVTPIDELRTEVVRTFIEQVAAERSLAEFQRQRIFYTTRDPRNRRSMHFESFADVDEIDEKTRKLLIEAYERIEVPGHLGKGLPASPASSEPSDSLVEEVT